MGHAGHVPGISRLRDAGLHIYDIIWISQNTSVPIEVKKIGNGVKQRNITELN